MTATRDLDFTPLTRSIRVRARLKAASANNLMVMGGTVGVLLIIVTVSVFVGLLATGNATDGGGLVVLAMCFGAGVYVLVDIVRKSGGGRALDDFARANDLVLLRGSMVPHYCGSLFADESHAVYQSIRTKDELFVEVGERFPATAPRSSRQPHRPQLFLRARLAGQATRDPRELLTPALHDELSRFAGAYTLEVSGDELTLFGNDGLEVTRSGRVQEAFTLVDELAARANAALVPTPGHGASTATPEPTRSGIQIPVATRPESQHARPPRARTVVRWTLALMIGGPIVIAIIMSILDDHLRGSGAARLVVSLIVVAAFAAVGRVAKAALTPRRTERSSTPE